MLAQLQPIIPLVNTSLIVISGVFLLVGYWFIKVPAWPLERRLRPHRACMITATAFAGLFLVVYVTRALLFETKYFAGEGATRAVYLTILISHTILATVVGPMALITLRRGLRGEYPRHRAIARFTLPIWLYVVVTGWLIYWMLHAW
ncbi:MAG: DUF420 domain-containing protein [Chloroflexota bacterium]